MGNNLLIETIWVIDGAVDGYIDDSGISKLRKILDEKLLNDPDYNKDDFINDFENICSDAGIDFDEFIRDDLYVTVKYDNDCLDFIKKYHYYTDWKELVYDVNGGEPFDDISRLVYCMLLNNFYQNGGEEFLAERVYDLITS